jgi:hypothetical protein
LSLGSDCLVKNVAAQSLEAWKLIYLYLLSTMQRVGTVY